MGQDTDISKVMEEAQKMLKKVSETQAKGEPRSSFPNDQYSTLKSNILAYQAEGDNVVLFLKGGETKILYKYTWKEVNKIIDG